MELTITKRKERCRKILNSLKPNENVTNQNDFNFLIETFKLNQHYIQKTNGHNIIKITKKLSGFINNNYCFYITMDDGTYTDISFMKIGKYTIEQKIQAALRHAIRPTIIKFRKKFKPFYYNNEYIDSIDKCDIDHYNLTFKELTDLWIHKLG